MKCDPGIRLISGCTLFSCILASCMFYVEPRNYEAISGEHCILLYSEKIYGENVYKEFILIADNCFETVVRKLGKPYGEKIIIVIEKDAKVPEEWIQAIALDSGMVTWNESVVVLPYEELVCLLKHEMTHIVMAAHFPKTDSVIMSEGIASYVEGRECLPGLSGGDIHIGAYLAINYYSLPGMDKELVADLYCTGCRFVGFWIERYGLSNFYTLYGMINTLNYRDSIEIASGISYELVISRYINWGHQ